MGWYYFVNSAGGRAVAAAATPPTQQDALNSPSSNPPAPREGPVLDVLRRPDSSHAQKAPPAKCALRVTHAENTSRVDSWHAELAAPQSPPLTRRGRTLGDARKDLAGATFQLGATPDPEASIVEMRRFTREVLSRLWRHRASCVGTGRAKLSRRPVARFCPIGSIPRLTPWQWSWHRAMLERAAPAVP